MARLPRATILVGLLALGAGLVGSNIRRGTPAVGAASAPGTVYGETVLFGTGTARSFVTQDSHRRPTALGIEFTANALSGLPDCARETIVPLPSGAPVAPYQHAAIDWRPRGHIPPHVYDVPHFDFHFYLVSQAERARITARGEDLARTQKAPPTGFLPEGYVTAPGAEEPAMGTHWVSQAAAEFHGMPFTHTFVYGSYNGRVNFLEPMVTLAFLQTRPNVSAPVPQPKRYQRAGYYPTQYRVRYLPEGGGVYRVSLDGLASRKAAP